MNEILIAFGVLLVVWLLLRPKVWRVPKSKPSAAWELAAYQTRTGIFVGRAEATFFDILRSELPRGYHVFAKVRLEDILAPLTKYKGEQFWRLRGRIKSRHVDYLICRDNGAFICAIELDGTSHQTKEAAMLDTFKDEIFKNAGLPLHRVRVGESFNAFCTQLCSQLTRY